MPHAGFYPQPSPKWLLVSPAPGSLAAHLGGRRSSLACDHLSISPGAAFTGSPRPQEPRAARPSGWCLHTRPPAPPLKPPCSPVPRHRPFQGCRAMAEQKARILTRDWPQFSLHHVTPWLCVLILQTPMPAPPEQVLPTPNLPGPQLPHGHKLADGARLSGPMRLPCTRDVPPAEVRGTCPGPLPRKSQPGTGGSAGADPP